jgi:hypothetical protein
MNKRSNHFVNDVMDDEVLTSSEYAREHPYEYVEQLRVSQGATCSCCHRETPYSLAQYAETSSVAVQKDAERRANDLAHEAAALSHALSQART